MPNVKREKHFDSHTQYAINLAVVRDEIGKLRVYQCHSVLHNEKYKSLAGRDFDNKTVGDILNRLQNNNNLRKIVRGS